MKWTVKTTNVYYCHFRTGNHSQRGFVIPSVPVSKGRFGSQSSLQASQSGSHGSQSDLSQTDSNPELNGSGRKLSNQSSPDHTPRRGSSSDKYVFRQNKFWKQDSEIHWCQLNTDITFIQKNKWLMGLLSFRSSTLRRGSLPQQKTKSSAEFQLTEVIIYWLHLWAYNWTLFYLCLHVGNC